MTVTAIATPLTSPSRGPLAALRHFIPRDEFFAGLYILGCANGLLGRMIYAAGLEGWTGAVVGVDANAIVLFAFFAGISVMLSADKDELRFADLAVGGAFL